MGESPPRWLEGHQDSVCAAPSWRDSVNCPAEPFQGHQCRSSPGPDPGEVGYCFLFGSQSSFLAYTGVSQLQPVGQIQPTAYFIRFY